MAARTPALGLARSLDTEKPSEIFQQYLDQNTSVYKTSC